MTENAVAGLIRAIVDNLEDAPDTWASLAMVPEFDETKVFKTSGYVYDADGTDTSRWSMTPARFATLRNEIRPDFS